MKVTIVYDNLLFRKDLGLISDWGFACLIDTGGETILFDTGAKGNILINNMNRLDIDPNIIDKIVVSHEHWDHNGGLKELLLHIKRVELYSLEKKYNYENINLISVENFMKITDKVYTTGKLKGQIEEQSLLIKGKKGWCIIVGCSHPGVEEILNVARHNFKIIGLIGGLHGFNKFEVLKNLRFICPCHCTVNKKILYEIFSDKIIKCGVGKIINLDH